MANYTIYPKSSLLNDLAGLEVVAKLSSQNGIKALLSSQAVSTNGIVPLTKQIPTADFISGDYTTFVTPPDYVVTPFTLPLYQYSTYEIAADEVDVFNPHALYVIGSLSDQLTSTFPINIYANLYNSNGESIPALQTGQKVTIIIFKAAGVEINFAASNIINNNLEPAVITASTILMFEVQRLNGENRIVQWFAPVAFSAGQIYSVDGNTIVNTTVDAGLKLKNASITSNKFIADTIETQFLQDEAVTTAKIADEAVTTAKIANNSINRNKLVHDEVINSKLADKSVNTRTLSDLDLILPTRTNGIGAVGLDATAFGLNSSASGTGAAYGNGAVALDACVALGYGAVSDGAGNVVIGDNAKASSGINTIVGNQCRALAPTSRSCGYGYDVAIVGSDSMSLGSFTRCLGTNSTVVGVRSAVFGANSMALGFGATVGTEAAPIDNKVRVGNDNITLIEGKVPFSWPSDARDKIDFADVKTEQAINVLKKLKTYTFRYNPRGSYALETKNGEYDKEAHAKAKHAHKETRMGFKAQEIAEILKEETGDETFAQIVQHQKGEGYHDYYSMSDGSFVPFLVLAVQNLLKRVEELEAIVPRGTQII